jgi:hypothetical protein
MSIVNGLEQDLLVVLTTANTQEIREEIDARNGELWYSSATDSFVTGTQLGWHTKALNMCEELHYGKLTAPQIQLLRMNPGFKAGNTSLIINLKPIAGIKDEKLPFKAILCNELPGYFVPKMRDGHSQFSEIAEVMSRLSLYTFQVLEFGTKHSQLLNALLVSL